MKQLGLVLDPVVSAPPHRFDGDHGYDPKVDQPRLSRQLEITKAYMLRAAGWRTLEEISAATGFHEASVSARLRDLRKVRFGAYVVSRRRRGDVGRGLFEYRVTPSSETPQERA